MNKVDVPHPSSLSNDELISKIKEMDTYAELYRREALLRPYKDYVAWAFTNKAHAVVGFDTQDEALKAVVEEYPEDPEGAIYKVRKVYKLRHEVFKMVGGVSLR